MRHPHKTCLEISLVTPDVSPLVPERHSFPMFESVLRCEEGDHSTPVAEFPVRGPDPVAGATGGGHSAPPFGRSRLSTLQECFHVYIA